MHILLYSKSGAWSLARFVVLPHFPALCSVPDSHNLHLNTAHTSQPTHPYVQSYCFSQTSKHPLTVNVQKRIYCNHELPRNRPLFSLTGSKNIHSHVSLEVLIVLPAAVSMMQNMFILEDKKKVEMCKYNI